MHERNMRGPMPRMPVQRLSRRRSQRPDASGAGAFARPRPAGVPPCSP